MPTDSDINTCPHIALTDSNIEWDPRGVEMATNRPYGENAILVNVMMAGEKRRWVAVENESNLCLGSISSHLVPEIWYEILINYVTVKSF